MKLITHILLTLFCALAAMAGQQGLAWNISTEPAVDRYVFRFATSSGGTPQLSVWLTNRLTASNTFTLPAGRWFATAQAVSTNGALSDASNEVMFDIPQPIVIRLQLSYAPNANGPWTRDPDTPPWIVAATEERKFYRVEIER